MTVSTNVPRERWNCHVLQRGQYGEGRSSAGCCSIVHPRRSRAALRIDLAAAYCRMDDMEGLNDE